jgi:hypothetical protein
MKKVVKKMWTEFKDRILTQLLLFSAIGLLSYMLCDLFPSNKHVIVISIITITAITVNYLTLKKRSWGNPILIVEANAAFVIALAMSCRSWWILSAAVPISLYVLWSIYEEKQKIEEENKGNNMDTEWLEFG